MKLDEVRRNYDKASKRYDRWNHLVFDKLLGLERQRARTVAHLGDIEGARVLDIACGTGLNFPHLMERVGPNGEIVGLDYSPGMLAKARARCEERGWGNVQLVEGDAGLLAGLQGPFDAVISTWALGIVDDLVGCLKLAIDALTAGGRMAILDFDRTVPDRGVHHLLSPLYHRVLLATGVDTREDLDDSRLRARWSEGKRLLYEHLEQIEEERYFETGFLLSGRKPLQAGNEPRPSI